MAGMSLSGVLYAAAVTADWWKQAGIVDYVAS